MTEKSTPGPVQPPQPNAEEAKAGRASILLRQVLLRVGPILALFALATYLSVATPHFLTVGNGVNVARQTSITAILAVGQTLVIITGGIDLSVGAMAAISACVAAVLMTQRIELGGIAFGPVPVAVGLIAALLVGTIAGWINGFIITRGRIPDFIATLGTLGVYRGIALLITGGLPVPSHLTATELKGYLPDPLIWLGAGDILGFPVAAIVAVVIGLVGWFILRYTALGRAAFAVGGNREAAHVSGINTDRTKVLVYTICGLMAAIGGLVLTGRLNSGNALMADDENLRSIAAVVIGGTNLFGGEGGVIGTLIGALIMGVLSNGLNLLNVSAFWQRIIQGVTIIVVVVFDQWRRRRLST